jgi:hypothetical protein
VVPVGNVNEILAGHIVLDLECLDRIYLNAYVPNLQVAGQVVTFFAHHRNQPIPSPALFAQIGNAFRSAVTVRHFGKADHKIEVVRPYFEAARQPGVVAIGMAQEFQSVFTAYERSVKQGRPRPTAHYAFVKEDRRVTVYYFFVADAEFGLGFIKICPYFPNPAKVWANGHDAAKELVFTELANGFESCANPTRLQCICDHLGPADLPRFFDRWMDFIPTPLNNADHDAGYWWELSLRQAASGRDLADVGLCSAASSRVLRGAGRRQPRRRPPRRSQADLRSPDSFGYHRHLRHQGGHPRRGRDRQHLLPAFAHQGVPERRSSAAHRDRLQLAEGQRTGALRFGDPRVMALVGALCITLNAVTGFTNRSLRAQVAGLLGTPYSTAQMTYDLRRLRRKGLIRRGQHSHM